MRSRRSRAIRVSLIALTLACSVPGVFAQSAAEAPVAAREAQRFEMHGVSWTDYYEWMKDVSRDDPETIAYVEAENAYTESQTAHLADFEAELYEGANQLGIGPMGFGGKTTVLGVKCTTLGRLPASYFVSVSYMCWACRRASMVLASDGAPRWA